MSPVRPIVAQRLFYRHRYRVTAAAALLAATAGFVNATAIVLTTHPISHHSGTIARLSQDVADGQRLDLATILAIVGAFFLGAMASGAIIGTRYLLPRRRYGLVLLLEGAALAVSAALFAAHPLGGVLLAAAACGLQNGMASSFYGVIVRTTHVSGLITDLAVFMGHWLRRLPVEGWRAAFQGSIVASFALGGVFGALAVRRGGPAVLVAPAALCALGGIGYIAFTTAERARRLQRRRAVRHPRVDVAQLPGPVAPVGQPRDR